MSNPVADQQGSQAAEYRQHVQNSATSAVDGGLFFTIVTHGVSQKALALRPPV